MEYTNHIFLYREERGKSNKENLRFSAMLFIKRVLIKRDFIHFNILFN